MESGSLAGAGDPGEIVEYRGRRIHTASRERQRTELSGGGWQRRRGMLERSSGGVPRGGKWPV